MKRPVTIPTILGILVAVAGLVAGLWLVGKQVRQEGVASVEETPTEVKLTNINDTSFTVSWITEKAVAGYVKFKSDDQETDQVVSDERDQQKGSVDNYFTHYVVIRGLEPETGYEFRIGSGKSLFDQGGVSYRLETAPRLDQTPNADVAYGKISTANGDPAEGAIVYYQLPEAVLLSALVKPSGSWVIPLSTARTADLDEYVNYDLQNTASAIVVQAGPLGTATAQVGTGSDSPVADMTLGENYQFNQSTAAMVQPTPPTDPAGGLPVNDLKLLTPKSGEKVNSYRPEIIGQAPAGTEITIEIHSDALVSGIAMADEGGGYSFSVPVDLPPGEHTVTVSAVIDGVVKKVTQSFVVYAAGESMIPAFTATPSATSAPSPTIRPGATITPTVKPTAGLTPTPIPTATIIPTARPTIILTPTETPATGEGLPESGSTAWTLWLVILAGGMLTLGMWGYRSKPDTG